MFNRSSLVRFYSSFPRIRSRAPEWSGTAVVNSTFSSLSSSDFKGQWLVLFFYPLDFTFVCPTEIIAFSDRISEFKKLNTAVVGVSIDSKFSHLNWSKMPRSQGGIGQLEYPLLSDITKSISKDYGVLIENGPDAGIALRGTFIMDPNGILKHYQANDLGVGRSVDEVLRLVEGFQFVEQHGEVCPVDWKKGKATIQPLKSAEYFKKTYKD
jgi:alkyl hydroperoxide reductase subunit AhpC